MNFNVTENSLFLLRKIILRSHEIEYTCSEFDFGWESLDAIYNHALCSDSGWAKPFGVKQKP